MADRTEILTIQNKLLETLRKNRKRINRISGVHHADVGIKFIDGQPTDAVCIRLHVYNKNTGAFLKRRVAPTTIDGLITDVIETTPVADVLPSDAIGPEIVGGLQIANPNISSIGTLGGAFRDNSGRIVGLSNHHVLLDNIGRIGDSVIQPFKVPTDPTLIIGKILKGNRDLDCAIFEFNGSRVVHQARIAGSDSPINSMDEPVLYDLVKKVGATTGLTFGKVEGIDEYGRITIGQRIDKPNIGGRISDLGDSGSVWLLDIENVSTAVGLHYQGNRAKTNAYAYNIRNVFSSLNLVPLENLNLPIA